MIIVYGYVHRFGIMSGKQFKALSNFKLDIEVEIKNSSGSGVLGYISTITLSDGKDLGYV